MLYSFNKFFLTGAPRYINMPEYRTIFSFIASLLEVLTLYGLRVKMGANHYGRKHLLSLI